ncbi:MAG TPA: hypothetical protein VMY41_03645 [Thermohalobaculum sp.]|nr:hypothetical protein [Thermohalobaculum sp.]
MRPKRAGHRARIVATPGDLAMFGEMLADFGADRLRQIVGRAFVALQTHLTELRRVVSRAGDAEECARRLHSMRVEGFDAGFRDFSDACRVCEQRARSGIALVKAEVEVLAEICQEARDRMERMLSVISANISRP